MKSYISNLRPAATMIALISAGVFSVSGIAQAQYGDNTTGGGSAAGQTGSTGQRPAPNQGTAGGQGSGTESGVAGHGILQEGVDTGFVDQEKRVERNLDPRSPSPDDHIDIRKEKEIRDPAHEQGGPIGPN
ncbi:MAG: hypothetical protein H0X43_12400 [Nitrosospira sp.]|nr:hypothetical protein [Nitrosospira sp.]